MSLELEITIFFKNHAFLECGGGFYGRVWLQIFTVRDKSSSIAVQNIFLFDCFKSDLSFEEMDEEHGTDDTTITR